jgi:hypothetical protein
VAATIRDAASPRSLGPAAPRTASLALRTPPWLATALSLWLGTRLALAGLYGIAALASSYFGRAGQATALQWDTGWYLGIAAHGYDSRAAGNFFPLYPVLTAALGRALALGHAPSTRLLLVAALLVANLGTLVAFCALAALVEGEDDRPTATATVRLLAAYPPAFFLGAAYSDGPFLAAVALAFLAARRRRWGAAAAAALAAGLLRPLGPLLALPLLWEAASEVRAGELRGSRRIAAALAAVAAAPLGSAAYAAYLWRRFGDPLLFAHDQATIWHHQLRWPWQTVGLALGHLAAGAGGLTPLDLGAAFAFAVLLAVMIRRLPAAFSIWTAVLLLAILISPTPAEKDPIHSTGRYLLAAFPAVWLVGRWTARRPDVQLALVAAGLMLEAGLAVVFLLGGPIY